MLSNLVSDTELARHRVWIQRGRCVLCQLTANQARQRDQPGLWVPGFIVVSQLLCYWLFSSPILQ